MAWFNFAHVSSISLNIFSSVVSRSFRSADISPFTLVTISFSIPSSDSSVASLLLRSFSLISLSLSNQMTVSLSPTHSPLELFVRLAQHFAVSFVSLDAFVLDALLDRRNIVLRGLKVLLLPGYLPPDTV